MESPGIGLRRHSFVLEGARIAADGALKRGAPPKEELKHERPEDLLHFLNQGISHTPTVHPLSELPSV